MNLAPVSPGSRTVESARRGRAARALPSATSLFQPQFHAVEQTSEPEFELLKGGPRCQLVGQLDHMRVLRGWQRAVEIAQRHVLRRAEAADTEVIHRLLQN